MELSHTAKRSGRLSSFLRGEMGMSAGLVNRLKWKERLLVNGQPRHTDYAVCPGDVITALLEEPELNYPAEQGELTVLYEDAHLLAVDKPAGMLIHPSRSRNTGTLANLVAGYYQQTGQASAFHPITRLDRDTFGIVLLAKNAHIHALLNQAHTDGTLVKTYHAWVFGSPDADSGIIDAPIARRPLPSLLRCVSADGKPSVTEFSVLQRQENCSKLSLRPITGRTHQLRLHCAHMGFPILGDPQYGSEESRRFSEDMGLKHQILCAASLSFSHPVTGEAVQLVSQMAAKL
ncbi:MAG: RluA family pseudouridine synthase [Oscillospiraceae bacterium]|nr:RluA family pseudouridine synthase [Oscillospiraceae bacterium]